jgi:hypothetical protein
MPTGTLTFDERGVAQDGQLQFEGATIDMRQEGLVAVLVSRAAVAPTADVRDDEAIRRNLMSALRWMRLLRWARWSVLVLWVVVLASAVVNFVNGGSVVNAILALAILAILTWSVWLDMRRVR